MCIICASLIIGDSSDVAHRRQLSAIVAVGFGMFFFLTFLTHFVCSIHSSQWPIYNLDIVNITTMHREEFFKWQRNGGGAVCG